MIGPALYFWMLTQQPEPTLTFDSALLMPMSIGEVVMRIPPSKDRFQLPVYFERRGDQRCVLLYTFGEDEKNWERIEMCSMSGFGGQKGRMLNAILNCAGKGCEP